MQKEQFVQGLELLKQPALPLASMVGFFLVTGEFQRAEEVIEQLPAPIETDYTTYEDPASLLAPYVEHFQLLLDVQQGGELPCAVVDESGNRLDNVTAALALVDQRILTDELEKINSLLCAPCGCTLCCVGPDQEMQQAFFEIPLHGTEVELFGVNRIETPESLGSSAMDEQPLQYEGRDFYQRTNPSLVHWKSGWSLILPKGSCCPNLEQASGRCTVYPSRPQVCRRPQVFPYILEPVDGEGEVGKVMRLRRSILAVIDCPYVQVLQDEIAAYAAACEVDVIFKRNKE